MDNSTLHGYDQPMSPSYQSYIDAKRRLLKFLSEKLRSGEITEEDYDKVVTEGMIPLQHAGVLTAGEDLDKPLPRDEVTTAARWLGLHSMEKMIGDKFPDLKSQMPRSRDAGFDR